MQTRRSFLASLSSLPVAALAQDKKLPEMRAITRGPHFHWRGYYDKLLFDPTDRFVLANEIDFQGRTPLPEDVLRVGMVDTQEKDAWLELGQTRAWNWQQGCMLQWVPGTESTVAWNDREGDHFVSHFLEVKTGKKRTLGHPFYTFSPEGKWAFAPDFRRLNDTRPGYGYNGVVDPNRERLVPEDAGIWKLNVETGKQELIFTFAQAAAIPFKGGKTEAAFKPESKHWFNHLLCNSSGTRLFFLHRWHAPGDKIAFYTRALTMNLDGSDVHVMDPHGGTSHFVWKDAEHVFAWAWHPSHGERFYLYRDKTDHVEVIGPDEMTTNGHNTYLPGTDYEWVLNDTYPQGLRREQEPYLYHIPTRQKLSLGKFPAPKEFKGEFRCDTHPSASRSGKHVVFDSAHEGGRQVYLADVSHLIG